MNLDTMRQIAGLCPTCGAQLLVLQSHTARNPGRWFAKCGKCGGFKWIDELTPATVVTRPSRTIIERELAPVAIADTSDFLSALDDATEGESEAPISIAPTRPFIPSPYQEAIFDLVRTGTGHAMIEAVAGSGKTTTLVRALEFTNPSHKVAFLAFNRHIAKELAIRAPAHVYVATLHSLGYRNIRAAWGKNIKVEDGKIRDLIKRDMERMGYDDRQELYQSIPTITRLISLIKANMSAADDAALDALCDHYSITTNGDTSIVYENVRKYYSLAHAQRTIIDYDDMIAYAAEGVVPCEQFDVIFADEAQDFSRNQIEFILRSVKPGGRIIAVGDRAQAIYSFRGADADAIPNLIEALQAITLPLSICYRCHKGAIRLAQALVPQIEARYDAPEGIVATIELDAFYRMVTRGDMVICRTNAPLVKPCFELIRRGVKATIRGRDIGQGIKNLVEKVNKRNMIGDLDGLLRALGEYQSNETRRLLIQEKTSQAQALEDQIETIYALSEGCETITDLVRRIDTIFSDNESAVVFSSCHRAKGLEAERVFILRPDLMPHKMATKAHQLQQEWNVKYIAITRAKAELYFVEGE